MTDKLVQLPTPGFDLVFVCRFCVHMAEQHDRGFFECGKVCGGVRGGRGFPLYKGPLTRPFIESHCYVCGVDAELQLTAEDGFSIGICKEHLYLAGLEEVPVPKQVEVPIADLIKELEGGIDGS